MGALRIGGSLWILLLSFAYIASGMAGERLPVTLAGANLISAKEVSALPAQAKIVDVRPIHDYLSSRIPNSLHISYRERSIRAAIFDSSLDDVDVFLKRLHKFVPNKETHVVMYCNGLQCWKSYKAASAAIKDGYRHISWFRGGIVEWEAQGFTVHSD